MDKANINLLPPELAPKTKTIKIASSVKKIATIGIFLYIIFVGASTAAVFLLSRQFDELTEEENRFKQSIRALEETEQRLILVQDRVAKAKLVLGEPSVKEEIAIFEELVFFMPEEMSVTSADANRDFLKIETVTQNSQALVEFFSQVVSDDKYREVILLTFNYSEREGYKTSFRLR